MTYHGMVRDSSPAWLREGGGGEPASARARPHRPLPGPLARPQRPVRRNAVALQELVDEGKISHVGVSNFDPHRSTSSRARRPVETLQPPYHLFRRGIEADLLPYAASTTSASSSMGRSHMAFSPARFARTPVRAGRLAQPERARSRARPTGATSRRCASSSASPASRGTRSPSWRSPGRSRTRLWTWRSWARAEPPTWTTAGRLTVELAGRGPRPIDQIMAGDGGRGRSLAGVRVTAIG